MMSKIQAAVGLLSKLCAVCMLTGLMFFATTPTASAAPTQTTAEKCTKSFLGLEAWFNYLPRSDFQNGLGSDSCDIKCFNILNPDGATNSCGQDCSGQSNYDCKSDVPLVLLAVIDDLLRIAGLVALGFVVYGGFQFVGSQGSSEATAKARNTIINALIGMAVASIAIAVVSFLGNKFG